MGTDSDTRSELRYAAPAGVLGIAWAVFPAAFGILLLGYLGPVSGWLEGHTRWGYVIYIAAFAIMSGCGLLPTYAQAVLGGWVFGVAMGLPAALAGFAGGAMIGYLITRLVARDRVETIIDRHPRADVVRDALIDRGFWPTLGVVTLLRVPPNSPFAITNLVMSSTGVPIVPYIVGTIIGMAPRTAVAVVLAASAAATGADDIQAFVRERGLWMLIAGIATLIIVVAIIGAIAKRALDRVTAGPDEEDSGVEEE